MNKGEWTNEEKLKIVQINREERQTGKYREKKKKRTAQNLVGNTRRFKKDSLEPEVGANIQAQKNID